MAMKCTFSNKTYILSSSNGGISTANCYANLPECHVCVCVCENSHHFKHLHFGEVGQARFEDIHRKNLTFGVTFPSHPEKSMKFHHSAGNLFLLQTKNPTKMAKGCCFLGPRPRPSLCIQPEGRFFSTKKCVI